MPVERWRQPTDAERNDARRACTDLGCPAVSEPIFIPTEFGLTWGQPPGWYKRRGGFMSWACPDHAPLWQGIDARAKARADERGQLYRELQAEFEERIDVLLVIITAP